METVIRGAVLQVETRGKVPTEFKEEGFAFRLTAPLHCVMQI